MSTPVSSAQRDAVAVLMADHQAVEQVFTEYQALGEGSLDRRRALVGRMIRELRVHASMEEQAFYPSVRRVLADGESLVEESLEEHQEAKNLLADLEGMSPDEPGFDAKVETLIRDVRHHVGEEEGEMLPKLQRAVGESWLTELGQELERTKERLQSEETAAMPAVPSPLTPVLTPEGPPSMREAARRERAEGARRPTTKKGAARRVAKRPTPRSTPKATARKSAATSTARKSTARKSTARKSTAKKSTGGRAARTVYHVTRAGDGRWQVAKKGASRASSTHQSKSEAVSRGRQLAQRQKLGQLVVHGKNGRIQNEYTYGADPRRSAG